MKTEFFNLYLAKILLSRYLILLLFIIILIAMVSLVNAVNYPYNFYSDKS